jgi:hypothetical protein
MQSRVLALAVLAVVVLIFIVWELLRSRLYDRQSPFRCEREMISSNDPCDVPLNFAEQAITTDALGPGASRNARGNLPASRRDSG